MHQDNVSLTTMQFISRKSEREMSTSISIKSATSREGKCMFHNLIYSATRKAITGLASVQQREGIAISFIGDRGEINLRKGSAKPHRRLFFVH